MLRFFFILGFILVLLVLEPACRKKQVAVPLPVPPAATAPEANTAEHPTPGPEPAPGPPPISTVPAQTPTPAPEAAPAPAPKPAEGTGTRYQVNRPAQPAQSTRKQSRQAPAAAAPPAPGPAPAPAPAAPAPQLGDILTPDQQREYNTAIDQSLSHAQASLGSIANRQLSKEQQGILGQIRSFIQQAQETRKSDLQGAKSLAERAEVLAGDLAASFR